MTCLKILANSDPSNQVSLHTLYASPTASCHLPEKFPKLRFFTLILQLTCPTYSSEPGWRPIGWRPLCRACCSSLWSFVQAPLPLLSSFSFASTLHSAPQSWVPTLPLSGSAVTEKAPAQCGHLSMSCTKPSSKFYTKPNQILIKARYTLFPHWQYHWVS